MLTSKFSIGYCICIIREVQRREIGDRESLYLKENIFLDEANRLVLIK